ncbi:MAG: hypothetical protein IJ169_04345 [Paludibacteraceae bacterium]|nr:hypothetical protein [Paludibacteraceae bacterium]
MSKGWRQRKKETDRRTVRVLHRTGYAQELAQNGGIVSGLSGKITADYHCRMRNGRIRVCKNPDQDVHGESLRTAHRMREVVRRASAEYRDADKRPQWEDRYRQAKASGETKVHRLWEYVCEVIRADVKREEEETNNRNN